MERKTYAGFITNLQHNEILVYGSNPEGRHGKGVARLALKKYGAKYGVGRGLCGKSYGLITKNLRSNYYEKKTNILYKKKGKRSVSMAQIICNIKELYDLAKNMKDFNFFIAYKKSGINLNGYTVEEMASMFCKAKPIPINIVFEDEFYELIKTMNC